MLPLETILILQDLKHGPITERTKFLCQQLDHEIWLKYETFRAIAGGNLNFPVQLREYVLPIARREFPNYFGGL